jgi:hypothetical protein
VTDYPENRAEAAAWLALGRSAEYAGARVHVTASTVRTWRRTDPQFRALVEQREKGLVGLGLQAITDGRIPAKVQRKSRRGLTPTEALRAMALELGRIEATRT